MILRVLPVGVFAEEINLIEDVIVEFCVRNQDWLLEIACICRKRSCDYIYATVSGNHG